MHGLFVLIVGTFWHQQISNRYMQVWQYTNTKNNYQVINYANIGIDFPAILFTSFKLTNYKLK